MLVVVGVTARVANSETTDRYSNYYSYLRALDWARMGEELMIGWSNGAHRARGLRFEITGILRVRTDMLFSLLGRAKFTQARYISSKNYPPPIFKKKKENPI